MFGSEYVRPIEQFHRESNITHWPTGSMQNIGFLLHPRSWTDKWHHKNGTQSIADPRSQTDKWDFGKHTNDTQSIADPIWQLDKWDFCPISGKLPDIGQNLTDGAAIWQMIIGQIASYRAIWQTAKLHVSTTHESTLTSLTSLIIVIIDNITIIPYIIPL